MDFDIGLRQLSAVCGAVGLIAATVGTIVWASCDPRSWLFGPVRWRGKNRVRPRIALTFDDGPTPGATDAVLEMLRTLNVPAAFFVIGQNVRQSPQLLRKIHEQGHLVGNHSFDHSHYGFLGSGKYWDRQLAETDHAVEEIIGERPKYFRAPIGVRTPRLSFALRRSGHVHVTWSRRGLDGVARSAQYIRDRLVGQACPGDILVLHDGVEPGGDRDPTASIAALPMIITGLRERGFEFVRLDELLNDT